MHRRVWSVVNLAKAFPEHPSAPIVLSYEIGDFDFHLSKVTHLLVVSKYPGDA
jgi:hypothetical protein